MALMEEVGERGLALPIGIGLVVAAISAGPKLIKAGRPLMKSAIKGYLAVQAKGKEMMAESSEKMQDLYAEAKHEYDEEMKAVAHEEPKAEAEQPAEGEKRSSRSKKKEESEE